MSSDLRQKLARFAIGVIVVLFGLQVTVAFAIWIDRQLDTAPAAIRVEGHSTPIPGTSTVMRVGVYDRSLHRYQTYEEIHAQLVGASDEYPLTIHIPSDYTSPATLSFDVPAEPVTLRVRVISDAIGERTVEVPLEPDDDTNWLEQDRFVETPVPRRPNMRRDQEPRVTVRDLEEGDPGYACPWRVSVIPDGGTAVRMVDSYFWVRVVDRAGAPVSGTRLELEGVEAREVSTESAVTDDMGTARFDVSAQWDGDWTLRYECEGAPVEREVYVMPSWDGIHLTSTSPVVTPQAPPGVRVSHQRSEGTWFLDIVCDGSWVTMRSYAIDAGTGVGELPVACLPVRSGDLRLCALRGYLTQMSQHPSQSISNVIVRDPDMDQRTAVTLLARRLAESGPERLRPFVREETLAQLGGASDQAVERFAFWLLSAMPKPYDPMPVIYDDLETTRVEFEARKTELQSAAQRVLLVDAIVVLVTLIGILIPASFRQRKLMTNALLEVGAEDGDEERVDMSAASGTRSMLTILVGLAIVIAFIAGLASLMTYMD